MLTDAFVLPAGAVLTPVGDLPESFRRSVGSESGDFAIARANSRSSAKLLNAEAAALVREFQEPSTIAVAVARLSVAKRIDADRLLEESLPILQSLIAAGLLVPAASSYAAQIAPSLGSAAPIEGWNVVRCVQLMQDTEIYQVRNPRGAFGALKLCREDGGHAAAAVEREADVLEGLDGTVNPRLLYKGRWNDRPCLITEWFPGVDVQTLSRGLRLPTDADADADADADRSSFAVAGAILTAYAMLHAQGVVHGDVHPRNVLIDRGNAVKLVDFGFAHRPSNRNAGIPPRAGVSFFFEPEFARALLERRQPPATTFAGEQYAVAALLYLLLTRQTYLNFIVERNEMLRQIAEEPMLPLAQRGRGGWYGVERVLRRALSKTPEQRFASMREFADAWNDLESTALTAARRVQDVSDLNAVGKKLLDECGIQNLWANAPEIEPPVASVAHGSAGVACALYNIAVSSDDAAALTAADMWSSRALTQITHPQAFYTDAFEIPRENVGSVSLYHGPAGVYAITALAARARGDAAAHSGETLAYAQVCSQHCDVLDLTLGRAGALLGCALLRESFNGAPPSSMRSHARDTLYRVGCEILEGLSQELARSPGVAYSQPALTSLGIAHGCGGLLYATLCWSAVSGDRVSAAVETRLQELADLAYPYGRGLQWPWDLLEGKSVPQAGWCNGSAGYVFLWTAAYRATGNRTYLELAEGAAWSAWEIRNAVPNLCCGLVGQTYALLNFHRHSGDSAWLHRARDLAQLAAVVFKRQLDSKRKQAPEWRPYSLHKGGAGLAALAVDLQFPESARMPLFELEA